MPTETTATTDTGSAAAGIRRDIVDLIRLARFVKQRQADQAAGGVDTSAADELLVTLRRELRIALRSRFRFAAEVAAGRPSAAARLQARTPREPVTSRPPTTPAPSAPGTPGTPTLCIAGVRPQS